MDGTFRSGRSPSPWRTVQRARRRPRAPRTVILALLVLAGCSAAPAAEVGGAATTTPPVVSGSSDQAGSGVADAAADGADPASGAEDAAAEGGDPASGVDLPDPVEEIAWALTPAGPGSPSVNEDSIYKVLDDLDPDACRALLDPASGFFEPGAFGTGERSVHLFRAAAHLCAGDLTEGEAAYQRALTFTWAGAFDQPLHSRVCNVWDAVTRMVDPGAGPCALEEFVPEDTTAAETPDTAPVDAGDDPGAEDTGTGGGAPDAADPGEPGGGEVDEDDGGTTDGAPASEGPASDEAAG